jgi:hypothetical protein
MTILLLEGFENWGTEANFEKLYAGEGDIAQFDTGTVRTGTYSAKLYYGSDDVIFDIPPQTSVCVGVAIYAETGFGTSGTIILFGTPLSSQEGLRLRCNGSNLYTIDSDGNTSYSSTPLVSAAWNYLECSVYFHETAGTVVVRQNGVEVINATGLDTLYSNNTSCQVILIKGDWNAQSAYGYIDDLYITTGEFLGPIKIYSFLPTSNGTHTDFTPLSGSNYENVDEAAPDDDTSYNTADAVGEKDTYNFTVSGVTGNIKGVGVRTFQSKVGTLGITTKAITRVNSTDYQGSKTNSPAEGYGVYHDYFSVNPDTSNPWTVSDVTSAEFGVEVTGFSTTTTTV